MRRSAMLTAAAMLVAAPPFAADSAQQKPTAAETMSDEAKTQAREHAPTNRIDKSVPTMKNTKEGTHPPTNRVGSEVPTMKGGDLATEESGNLTPKRGDGLACHCKALKAKGPGAAAGAFRIQCI